MSGKIKKIFSENNHKSHWQWYKNFFNITILRYLVTWFAIVPLFVKIVEVINRVLKAPKIQLILENISLSLPFYWELLWLSSLFFVIALTLYQLFCPQFIKTYNSFGDYKKRLHSPRWIIWESLSVINDKQEIGKLFDRLSTKNYIKETKRKFDKNEVVIEENQTTAYFEFETKKYSLSLPIITAENIDEQKTELVEREIFWEVFGRFSSSKKGIRITIITLLILSAILFGVVFLQNIVNGFEYIISTKPCI